MTRHSPHKKAISPEAVVDSDDENFNAVASDDQYALHFIVCCILQSFLILPSIALMRKKTNPSKMATMGKRTSMVPLSPLSERSLPRIRALNWRRMKCKLPPLCFPLYFSYYVCFHSIEITPPPTLSPVKAASGKKRAIAVSESDEDDVFVPRYEILLVCCIQNIVCWLAHLSPTRDSPKKPCAKEPFTPSKVSKSAHQFIFDAAV